MTLYDRIGANLVSEAITEFYRRAFEDGIIGHFFFGKDREEITAKQISFAASMLGGPRNYQGRPLEPVHRAFDIRRPHFDRRQRLMAEVLNELGLDAELRDEWLALEEQLRPLIVRRTKTPPPPL